MPKHSIAAKNLKNAQLFLDLWHYSTTFVSAAPKYNFAAKNRRFKNANNHPILTLLINICFGTSVLALMSAEVDYFRHKKKYCYEVLSLLNNVFFGTIVQRLSSVEKQHYRQKTEERSTVPKTILLWDCLTSFVSELLHYHSTAPKFILPPKTGNLAVLKTIKIWHC